MSVGEGADVGFQLGIAGKAQSVRRHFGGRCHGEDPGARKFSESVLEAQGGRRLSIRRRPRARTGYERSASWRKAKRPGPVLAKRDALPFCCTSRISAAYNVDAGVLPLGDVQ